MPSHPFRLAPALEREISRSYGRASTASPWWKDKMAEFKFCPRCAGALGWSYVEAEKCRRVLCRSCRFIFYQNPKVVAATVPERDGRVYLLRRNIEPSLGLWTFPAGYMEMGETVEQAAARETREEIRCRVKILGLLDFYSYDDAGVVTVVYRARVVGREPRPGMEAQAVRAFRPAEIPWRRLAFRSTFHALRDWVRRQ